MKMSAFCLAELTKAEEIMNVQVDIKDNKIIEKQLDIEGDA